MGETTDANSKPLHRVKKKCYKMIIRRLPFELSEEELMEKLSPLPPHERFWYRKGEEYLEDDAFPYAFIVFDNFDEAAKFQKTFNGQLFVDSEGNESTVIVEKAANQDYAKEPLKPKAGITPITDDIGFIQFLEEANGKSITKKVDFDVLVNEITERERRHAEGVCQDTPLTDYFIKKVHEKIFKNRPKPKKPEPKAAAVKSEKAPPRKSTFRNGGEPKEQQPTDEPAKTEKKKRERPPRKNFEKKKLPKDDETPKPKGKQMSEASPAPPDSKAKEPREIAKNSEKAAERKQVGPSQRNKDRPERAIYQPGRNRRGGKSTNENVKTEE